jgi:hypothetical protein
LNYTFKRTKKSRQKFKANDFSTACDLRFVNVLAKVVGATEPLVTAVTVRVPARLV